MKEKAAGSSLLTSNKNGKTGSVVNESGLMLHPFGECSALKARKAGEFDGKSHGGFEPFTARKADGRWNIESVYRDSANASAQ